MIEFKVIEGEDALRIGIEGLGDKQPLVLKALQECAQGRCTCPTAQYEKLESVEITPGADGIQVALVPRAGETIDRQAIDKCLGYTAAQLAARE